MTGPTGLAEAIARHGVALAAFDVDGTLLTSDHRVTDRLVAAVAGARAAGVEIVLASSRGASALRPVLATLGLDEPGVPFVAAGGAFVGTRDGAGALVPLAHRPAPLAGARAFARSALAAGLAVGWYAGDDWYVAQPDATIEAEIRVVGVEPTVVAASAMTQDPSARPAEPIGADAGALPAPDKILVMAPEGRMAAVEALRADLPPGLSAQTSNPTFLEINGAGVDKAVALADLASERGLPTYGLLAMGDGPNDAAMLALAGLAVVPANAREAARAHADVVVPSNDEYGAAIVLEALARRSAARPEGRR